MSYHKERQRLATPSIHMQTYYQPNAKQLRGITSRQGEITTGNTQAILCVYLLRSCDSILQALTDATE
jgi:hypothetical protein